MASRHQAHRLSGNVFSFRGRIQTAACCRGPMLKFAGRIRSRWGWRKKGEEMDRWRDSHGSIIGANCCHFKRLQMHQPGAAYSGRMGEQDAIIPCRLDFIDNSFVGDDYVNMPVMGFNGDLLNYLLLKSKGHLTGSNCQVRYESIVVAFAGADSAAFFV